MSVKGLSTQVHKICLRNAHQTSQKKTVVVVRQGLVLHCLQQRKIRHKVSARPKGGYKICDVFLLLERAHLVVLYLCLLFKSNTDSNFMVILLLLLKGEDLNSDFHSTTLSLVSFKIFLFLVQQIIHCWKESVLI